MSEKPRICVLIADGTEEIEAVVVIDVLRRAGCEVTVAGVGKGPGEPIIASRSVALVADVAFSDLPERNWSVVVVPGGAPGVDVLRQNAQVLELIQTQYEAGQSDSGRIVAAICAGPLVLQEAGVLEGRKFTCYPSVLEGRSEDLVVVDGGIVTSQGPGTSFVFALELVRIACGAEIADHVAKGLLLA